MRDLTTYNPQAVQTSGDEEEKNDNAVVIPPQLLQEYQQSEHLIDEMAVDERDVALLRVIVKSVDGKNSLDDFSELYDAFESYVKSNGVKNYSQCFCILVKLCGYKQETWGMRLEQCLRDYSLGEYAERRDALLSQRWAYFNLLRKKRLLAKWLYRYDSISGYFEKLHGIAEDRDSKQLIREGFNQWVQGVAANNRQRAHAESHYKERLLGHHFKLIRTKSDQHQQRNNHMTCFVYEKFFCKWKQRYQKFRSMNEFADKMNTKSVRLDFLTDWAYAAIENKVARKYNQVMLNDAISTWTSNTDRLQELTTVAVERDTILTTHKSLNKWRTKLEITQSDGQVADEMCQENLLRRIFRGWCRAALCAEISQPYQNKVETNLLREYLQTWRLRTQQSRECNRFRSFMLQHRMFKTWRLEAGANQVIQVHNYRLAQQAVQDWVLQERLRMFRRYRDGLLMMKWLYYWKDTREVVVEDLQSACAHVEQSVAKRTLARAMNRWIDKTVDAHEMQLQADQTYEMLLKSMAMSRIYRAVDATTKAHTTALTIDYDTVTTDVFKKWRTKASSKKQQRLQSLYHDFHLERTRKLKHNALQIWVNATIDVASLAEMGQGILDKNTGIKARSCMHTWIAKNQEISRQNSRADAIYADRSMSQAFTQWHDNHQYAMQISSQADILVDIKSQKLQERFIRSWQMRMFRLNSLQRDGEAYYDRLQKERFRTLFRTWYTKAHDNENNASLSDTIVPESTTSTNPSLETPSKVMQLPKMSSIDRWRQLRTSSPRLNRTATPAPAPASTPVRRQSSLRHQLFLNTPM